MSILTSWRHQARQIKTQAHTLYRAYKDPRVPWYARLYAAVVVAYVLSPIDPIPDFIPLLGYLDELVLLPLLVLIARRLIPAEVLAEHRAVAAASTSSGTPKNWLVAGVIVAAWLLIAVFGALLVIRVLH